MEEDKKKDKKNLTSFKLRKIWLYTKYQLITKIILAITILPLYNFATHKLILSSGRTNISSGDFLSFLFSINGAWLLIFTYLLMTILIATDINAFIIISSLIKEKQLYMRIRDILLLAIKSIKSFFNPYGILLIALVSLIFPLVGLGVTVLPIENFHIPNFITSVIYNNPLYNFAYMILILVFLFIEYKLIFSFHYIVICGYSAKTAMKKSRELTKKYKLSFLKDFILFEGVRLIIALICLIGLIFLSFKISDYFIYSTEDYRISLIFSLLLIVEFLTYILFIFTPLLIERLTTLFFKYNEKEGHPIRTNFTITTYIWDNNNHLKLKIKTKIALIILLITTLIVTLITSVALAVNFDTIFKEDRKIDIISHRGGGDLGAENTLEGLEAAIKENVAFSEIDVQRTKDNYYVINHDKNFKRLTGDSRSSKEMTLKEIQSLLVKNEFEPYGKKEKVATLDEMIKVSKGRIGLFIELKGETADKKMADDIVKKIKENGVEKEAVLISLDYSLIEYIEKNYPEIQTGYLYFFSVGDLKNLIGDYLIMEERAATYDNISKIHEANKKAVVWTVNTKESMEKFVKMPVDGIITDHVNALKSVIKAKQYKSDLDVIIDKIFDF